MAIKTMLIVAIFTVSALFYTIVSSHEWRETASITQPRGAVTDNHENNTAFDQLITALQLNPLDNQAQQEFSLSEKITMNKILNNIEPRLLLVENIIE